MIGFVKLMKEIMAGIFLRHLTNPGRESFMRIIISGRQSGAFLRKIGSKKVTFNFLNASSQHIEPIYQPNPEYEKTTKR